MQVDQDGCLDLLLARRPAVPPDAALAALHTAAPALEAPYLEAAIEHGIASAAAFHATLARIYMAELAQPPLSPHTERAMSPTALQVEAEVDSMRKLLKIITESPFVQPAELLRQMPDTASRSLLLARAALHERQQHFQDALHVYAHRLGDHAAAEAFADRLYDAMMVWIPPSPSLQPTSCLYHTPQPACLSCTSPCCFGESSSWQCAAA